MFRQFSLSASCENSELIFSVRCCSNLLAQEKSRNIFTQKVNLFLCFTVIKNISGHLLQIAYLCIYKILYTIPEHFTNERSCHYRNVFLKFRSGFHLFLLRMKINLQGHL